jgi:hypothetical protein
MQPIGYRGQCEVRYALFDVAFDHSPVGRGRSCCRLRPAQQRRLREARRDVASET